jgi:cell division septation protein DedD
MIQQERRLFGRKALRTIACIHLPFDNGGIVLDVSEGGLRFRAIAPVEESGPIHFWFSAHPNRIAGTADLVWTDRAKKTGGLRFAELPEDARELIRSWPNESSLPPGISNDLTPDVPAPDESSPSGTNEPDTGAARASDAPPYPESPRSELYASTRVPSLRKDLAQPYAPASETYFEERKRSPFKAICISVLMIVILALSYRYAPEAGEWRLWRGIKISGESKPQEPTQTRALNLPSEAMPVGDASADNSKDEGMSAQAAPQSSKTAAPETARASVERPLAPQVPAANARIPKPLAPGREFVVQVAAVTEEVDARKLADSLRHKNFPVFVRTPTVDSFYRVLVGPYADDESARIARLKLKKAGFNPFIRHWAVAELSGSQTMPKRPYSPHRIEPQNSLPIESTHDKS